MKTLAPLNIAIAFLLGFLVTTGCSETEPEVDETNVKLKKVMEIGEANIENMFKVLPIENIEDFVKYDVEVYEIQYPMEYKGQSITASGLVSVPKMSGENFPLLMFQHGTMVAKNEAPTINPFATTNIGITALASAGYVVIYPDLIGFGASESFFHPYLVKQSHIDAATAMLNSVWNLPDGELSGVNPNEELYLMGYSQGGWITLALHQYLEENSHPYSLVGSACGAGPYQPKQLQEFVFSNDTYPRPYFMPYVFLAYQDEGSITSPLSSYFNEPYAQNIPGLFDGMHSGSQIDAELSTNSEELYTPDFLSNFEDYTEVNKALEKNSIAAWSNTAPIFFGHGTTDTYIPPSITENIVDDFLNIQDNSVSVEYFSDLDHLTAAPTFIGASMQWFQTITVSLN